MNVSMQTGRWSKLAGRTSAALFLELGFDGMKVNATGWCRSYWSKYILQFGLSAASMK